MDVRISRRGVTRKGAGVLYNPAAMTDDPRTPRVAKLALKDGTVFTGRAFGHPGTTEGEVVFNTPMTGYQEILTDPP